MAVEWAEATTLRLLADGGGGARSRGYATRIGCAGDARALGARETRGHWVLGRREGIGCSGDARLTVGLRRQLVRGSSCRGAGGSPPSFRMLYEGAGGTFHRAFSEGSIAKSERIIQSAHPAHRSGTACCFVRVGRSRRARGKLLRRLGAPWRHYSHGMVGRSRRA